MVVRIITNILTGDYETRRLNNGLTARDLLLKLELDESCAAIYDGTSLVLDLDRELSSEFVTVKIVPGGLATALSIVGIVISAVALGFTLYSYFNQPTIDKVQTSPSLRGSSNTARQNSRIPLLLGRHRVYPDVAALPYTSYASQDQYLHQLFCFGYNNVGIDMATLKIGETPVASYDGVIYESGFATIYPYRCIESTINIKLANDGTATPVIRNTASGTYQIRVGLAAPSGIYKFNDDGDRETYNIGFRIEWRVPDETWQIAVEQTIGLNVDKWRQSFQIMPTGADDGQYEVRVTRTSAVGTNSSINDYLYWDVLQCLTADADGQTSPVPNYGRYCLLSTKIKATNQLNGVVDSLNAIATLRTRMYLGSGTGADAWAVAETRNPASAILYLLTDPYANPKPISDAQIDWAEFEEFYEFCETNSLTCDAWITGEYTVLQLCQYIAQSNMAELRLSPNLIGIRIDQENVLVSQMFTPRNAWAFNMEMSFADPVRNLRLKYVDANLGYVEVERLISINDENEIVYDAEQDGDDLEVTCIGITSAEHAAKLGALRLKQTHLRRRTYTWKTDIEGIICVPGDVVLIENDNFMLGLGEARIKRLVANDDGDIAAVVVDSELKMEDGSSYGLQIRNKAAMISAPLTTKAGSRKTLYFSTPVESGSVEEGDLVSFGYYQSETLKVMVTKISYDSNHACSFTAIEYAPECYDALSDTIPEFNPGISRYPNASPGQNIIQESSRKVVEAFIPDYKARRFGSETIAPSLTGDVEDDHIVLILEGGKKDENGDWIISPEINLAVIKDGTVIDENNPYKDSLMHLEFAKNGSKRALVFADDKIVIEKESVAMKGVAISESEITGSTVGGQFIGEINSYGIISMPSPKGVTMVSLGNVAYGNGMAWSFCNAAKSAGITEGQKYICEITGESNVYYCVFRGLASLPSSWGNADCSCTVEFWGKNTNDTVALLFWIESSCWYHTEWYSFLWGWGAGWRTSGGRMTPSVSRGVDPISSITDFLPDIDDISGYGSVKASGSGVGQDGSSTLLVYRGSQAMLSFPNMPQDLASSVDGCIYVDSSDYIRYNRP